MEIDEFKKFLSNFISDEKIIDDVLKDKKIKKVDNNIFLVPKTSMPIKGQVYTDTIIFVKLKKLLPSKFLLSFIKDNSESIDLDTEKKALDYSYGKDVIIKNRPQSKQKFYIVIYEDNIMGYGELDNKKIKNIMNIGEYLKE
jgi:hypothetical protein